MSSRQKRFFFSSLFIDKKGRRENFRVESQRLQQSYLILKLEGIDSISHAQEYVGEDILCPEDNLAPLELNEFYAHQLEGCLVFLKEGEKIGRVRDVMTASGNELLVVEGSGKEFLVPFAHSICLEIDVERKTIIIDPPKGLLDIDEI